MRYKLRKVNLSPKIWILKNFFVSLQKKKIKYTMKDSCLDCQFYKHIDLIKEILDGINKKNGAVTQET